MYTEKDYNDSLCHHGIKGQKWGVRRFQNADGSYTAAGANRYGYKTAKKQLKNRLYSEYDRHENMHESQIEAHNKKYGQYQNNHSGKNRKLSRSEKKAYEAGSQKLWNDYESKMNTSRAKYKKDLSNLRKQALKKQVSNQLAASKKYASKHSTAGIVTRQIGKTFVQGAVAGLAMTPLILLSGPAMPLVATGSAVVGTIIAGNNASKAVTSIGYKYGLDKKIKG